jgi:hypothetical protein
MHKYLPARNRRSKHVLTSRERINSFKVREGGVNSLRQKVVCQTCNNNWMSAIETKAKEGLRHLMAGEQFIVTSEHQQAIARWAILKSIAIAYDTPLEEPVYSPAECSKFMNDEASDKWLVWIGRCQSERWRTRITRQQTGGAMITGYWPRVVKGVLQSTAIGLNELFIYVVLNKHEAIRVRSPAGLCQIWPSGEDISWPPPKILTRTEAEAISTGLLRFTGQWPPPAYGLAPATIRPINSN